MGRDACWRESLVCPNTAQMLTFTLDDPEAMTLVDVDANGAPRLS